METNYSFSGMTLTQIFEIQPLQSLFIKFWYLGLSSEGIVAGEDAALFRAIRKNLSFANCFTFEMPLRSYINFMEKIIQSLAAIDPRKTFQILLGHLRNNKVISVSFQLFGVAFLQLFGRILELLNTQTMNKILRKVFVQITLIGKLGISTLKLKGIRPVAFEELIPNFTQLIEEKSQQSSSSPRINPQHMPISIGNTRPRGNSEYDMKTFKGRFQGLRQMKMEHREEDRQHYPPGDKLRNREKASLSCFMMGGFQIVDYSESINHLHKKLLTKIMLNK